MADHQSRGDTERRGYERMREAGMGHSDAKRTAEKAAAEVHRTLDKKK